VEVCDEVIAMSDDRSRPGLYAMVMVLMVWLLLTMFQVGAIRAELQSGGIQVQCK
jgi:hypothetical protein